MEAVVSRLERVAAQLEAVQIRASTDGSSTTSTIIPTKTTPAQSPPPPSSTHTSNEPIEHFKSLLNTQLASTTAAARSINDDQIIQATSILADAFTRELSIISAFTQCSKPSDPSQFQSLLQPVAEKLIQASNLTSGPRSPFTHHFKLLGEASQSLSWVAYTGPQCGMPLPGQYIDEVWSACEFYANKILMEWRAKDPHHVDWVNSIKSLLMALKQYCIAYYPNGPRWNDSSSITINSKEYTTAKNNNTSSTTTSTASQKAKAPVPPPPPPPGFLQQQQQVKQEISSPANPNPMAALFAEINQGDSIASKLKKVTDDMKTKNRPREERSGAVISSSITSHALPTSSTSTSTAVPGAIKTKAPITECQGQGRKWVIENHINNPTILIEDTQPKQTVYIYNCKDSTIQIKGKVNAITLDACTKTGLVFDNVVSSVEIVNCTAIEVQCTDGGAAPTIAIDKSDGCHVYLPRHVAMSTEITTAKSSEINIVIVAGESDGNEAHECALPEQFVSRYREGIGFVTEPVKHSGA